MSVRPARLLAGAAVVAWFVGWIALFIVSSDMHPVIAVFAALLYSIILGFAVAGLVTEILAPLLAVLIVAAVEFVKWVFEPRKPVPPFPPEVMQAAWQELEQDVIDNQSGR